MLHQIHYLKFEAHLFVIAFYQFHLFTVDH